MIFTHFTHKPDLTFSISGPFEPYRLSENAARMLEDAQWSEEVPQQQSSFLLQAEPPRTYRDLLIWALQSYYRTHELYFTRRALLEKGFPNGLRAEAGSIGYPTKGFFWVFWGSILTSDPEKLVNENIVDAQAAVKRMHDANLTKEATVEPRPSQEVPNYGAILYPAIWVGDRPIQSIEDRILGKSVHTKVILNEEFGNYRLLMRQDGLVGIELPDIVAMERKTKAIETINELVAAFALLEIPLDAIREHDMIEANVNHKDMTLTIRSWNPARLRTPVDTMSPSAGDGTIPT